MRYLWLFPLLAACSSTPAEVIYDEGLNNPITTPYHEAWLEGDQTVGWTIELVRRDRAGGPTFLAFSDAVVAVIRMPAEAADTTRYLTYEAIGFEIERYQLAELKLDVWKPGERASGRFMAWRLQGNRRIDLRGRFDARPRR
ncbi:MAG: hypothetical protein ACYTGN_00955 [Planctomycetota bacterium]